MDGGKGTSQHAARTPVETDCEFLLRVLSDHQPHNLNDLLQRSFAERGCGLTVHSRASNLRDQGHSIINYKTGRRGAGSWYQLLNASSVATESVDDALSGGNNDLLNGDDSPHVPAAPIEGQQTIYDLAEAAA